jgi:hypothetical protein
MSDTVREALNLTLLGTGVVVVLTAISIALFLWWKRASERKG